MIRKATIIVSGIVQGVYYRYSTEQKADELRLTGYARNLIDGSVEVVAEGEEESIERLIEWCRQGPRGARVDHIDVKWDEPSSRFEDFSVRY
jgi:acylphosphatase